MVDFSSRIVVDAPRSSLRAFFRAMEGSAASETLGRDELFFWHTEVAHPWFNGVLISRRPRGDERETIQEITDFFRARKVMSHTVWLENDAWVEEWAVHLQPAGYSLNLDPPGMAVELAKLPASVAVPEGFTIRQVEDLDMLRTLVRVFITGYGVPGDVAEPYYRLMASLGTDLPARHYLGFLNGIPVTAATLFLSEGIAGIYSVATLPEARGKGLGAAITLKPLLEARQMGFEIGALQSSEMGFQVYQRLGFRKVCDVRHFYFKA